MSAEAFAEGVLNALVASVVVLDSRGVILAVNESWKRLTERNGSNHPNYYLGENYLEICQRALHQTGDPFTEAVVHGLRAVTIGALPSASIDYPVVMPESTHWFNTVISRFTHQSSTYLVVTHRDVSLRKQTEDALRESQARLNGVLLNSPDTMMIMDVATRVGDLLNRNDFLGYSEYELKSPGSILTTLHPDDLQAVRDHYQRLLQGQLTPGTAIEYRLKNKAGEWEWIHQRQTPVTRNPDGTPRQILFTYTVVTERKLAEESLRASEEKWRRLFAILPVGVSVIDKDRQVLEMNLALEDILQISKDGLKEGLYRQRQYLRSDDTPVAPTDFPTVQAINEQRTIQDFEMAVVKEDGGRIWTSVSVTPLSFADARAVVVTTDITQRKQAEAALQQAKQELEQANHDLQQALSREQELARVDSLTGLNNRRHFFDLAAYAFEVAKRYHQPLSIAIFDLDHFKEINDTHGHQVGDQVLAQVTHVMSISVRRADILGRYGGEEIVMLLPNTTSEHASIAAEHIRERIARLLIETPHGPVSVTLSAGVADMLPTDETIDMVIYRADMALYEAKTGGRNRTFLYSSHPPSKE